MPDAGAIGTDLIATKSKFQADVPPGAFDHWVLMLPGTNGNYASTPDSVANSITGNITLSARLIATDWTPVSVGIIIGKRSAAAVGSSSYSFYLDTTGKLGYAWSDNVTIQTALSTVAPAIIDGVGLFVRVTHTVNNAAAGNDVKFYTSYDGVTWTQLGTTVTTAGVTSIFDSTAAVEIGSQYVGTDSKFVGTIYWAEIRTGLVGAIVNRFEADVTRGSQAAFTAASGEVWTINTSGSPKARIEHSTQLGLTTRWGLIQAVMSANGDAIFLSLPKRINKTSTNYTVSGTVKQAGVLTVGVLIKVFDRSTGTLLGATVSIAGGVWSIPIIGFNGEVTCVAYDPAGGIQYNAAVFDQVTPG